MKTKIKMSTVNTYSPSPVALRVANMHRNASWPNNVGPHNAESAIIQRIGERTRLLSGGANPNCPDVRNMSAEIGAIVAHIPTLYFFVEQAAQ